MLLTGVRGDVNSAFGVYKMSNASCVHGNNELLSMTQGIKGERDSDNLLLSSTEYIVDLFLRTGYLFQFISPAVLLSSRCYGRVYLNKERSTMLASQRVSVYTEQTRTQWQHLLEVC